MGIVIAVLVLILLVAGAAAGFYLFATSSAAAVNRELQPFAKPPAADDVAGYFDRGTALIPRVRQAQSLLRLVAVLPAPAALLAELESGTRRLQGNLARASRAGGDPAKARHLLQELVAAGAAASEDLFTLLELQLRDGDLAGAEQLAGQFKDRQGGLKDRLRASSGNPDHEYAVGLIAAAKGEVDAALGRFREMLRLDPKSAARLLGVADLVLAKNPESPELFGFLGDLYDGQGQTAKALECYQKSLTGTPADRPRLEKLLELQTRASRWDAALAAAEKLLALEPRDIAVLKQMRVLLEQKGATDRLIRVYEQLAEAEPDQPEHLRPLLGLYKTVKRWDDAARLLARLIDLQPNQVEHYFSLAELHMRTGASDKAIFAYEKLMQQDLSLRDFAMVKQVMESLEGILKAVPGDIAALKLLVQAREKLNLDGGKYRYRLAKALLEAGRGDDAFTVAQQLWKEAGEYQYPAGLLMGQCWLQKDSADLALRHFAGMLSGGKLDPERKREIQYHLGLAHEQTGNWDEARSIYGDILLTALAYRDVTERFERVKKKLEGKRRPAPAAAGDAGSTVTDLNLTRFELREELGKGGMGVVYRAHDTKLDRDVALKVLTGDDSAGMTERLIREAQSAAILNHPHIVAIYDVNDSGPVKYIAMELVEGGSLRQLLDGRKGTALPEPEARRLILEFLDAMTYAHGKGIVHRDIKPENVMLDGAGKIKVTDFGLARLESSSTITQPGMAVGTVAYMAPEQIRGEKADGRVDIYAAGCMFYELLCGRPPFSGTDIASIIYNHLNVEPPRPSELNPGLRAEWDTILPEMLAKQRDARTPSFADVSDDVRKLA